MLLAKKESLEEVLVTLLARRPDLTAERIMALLGKQRGASYSRAAVYKELKKLTEGSVLYKHERRYRLHLNWAIDFQVLSGTIARNYLELSPPLEYLPSEGQKLTWKLRGFFRLMAYWDNITLYLMKNARSRHCLCWYPHSWFWMFQSPDSGSFFRAVKACKVHSWRIIGGRSLIDRLGPKVWDPALVTASFATGPFDAQNSSYFYVIDDFVFGFSLEKRSNEYVKTFLGSIEHRKDLTSEAVEKFFSYEIQSTFRVEKNSRKAALIKRKFEDYFGRKIV